MNTQNKLSGKKVAILATDGFEQSELESPREALLTAGAKVDVISLQSGSIKGWSGKNWGNDVSVDKTLEEVDAADYDGLVLPGGLINPDTLRQDKQAIRFIQGFFSDSATGWVSSLS